MSKVTFTEEEVKMAKEGLDFLINKGKFELTGVEAFSLAKKISVLSRIPALLEQYVLELRSVVEAPPEKSTPKGKK